MNTILKLLSNTLLILYYWIEGIIMTFVPRRFKLKDITRETALITGGGSGMGRLLALRLAKLGTRVVLWDVNKVGNEETAELVKKIGGEAFPYYCDISDRKQVYQQAARVKDEVGKVTMLINNAGVVSGKRFLDIPDEKIVQTFDVNIMSHFWTCKAFLPDMIQANHGHIVSISSMAGLSGVVRLTDYCASKFAAIGFEEALRLELLVEGHSGIHSTVVCPFFTSTGMFNGVRTGCFSLLDPDYVADEIIAAIRTNQEILMLPRVFYFLVALKSWFPSKVVDDAMRLFGISTAMSSYTGRQPGGGEGIQSKIEHLNNNNIPVKNGLIKNGH